MHYTRASSGLVLLLALLIVPFSVHAAVITGDIELPENCIANKDGTPHAFPKGDSPSTYLAVCALTKAIESGVVSDVQFGEFEGFGLYVEGINGIVAGGDEYWALWLNGDFAECGVECLPLSKGDVLSFILTSFDGEDRGSSLVLNITSLISPSNSPTSGGGGGGEYLKDRLFDISKALTFLAKHQRDDGSFSSPLLTDWAAIAFGAADETVCNNECSDAREKLRTYLSNASTALSPATEIERRIMALEALGVNPFSTSSHLVDALIAEFDGTQMGSASIVNDDIFAIFPLRNAGFTEYDPMISAIGSFILSKQHANGSWEESVDLTAAAIQSIELLPWSATTAASIEKAEQFLRFRQDSSGIFGSDGFSIGWILQAIASLGQTPKDWVKSGVTLTGYLGVLQQEDGGIMPTIVDAEKRIWATSYAIPGALGKQWDVILEDFTRPLPAVDVPATTTKYIDPPEKKAPVAEKIVVESDASEKVELIEATSSAHLVVAADQVALVGEAPVIENINAWNSVWTWILGFLAIFFALVFFYRRS